ncbi:MAG: TlpA disulfide reductase family protein [Pyrinomonadaceae bacterium]
MFRLIADRYEELMKEMLKNLVVFVILALAVSTWTSCNSSSASSNGAPQVPSNAGLKASSIYPKLAEGLAEAEQEKLDGTPMKISDHKGKVLLLNIWGTWCGPCRAEIPHLVAMREKYGDQGFDVIGMNIGDNAGGQESVEDINAFAERMKINYTMVRTPPSVVGKFYSITKQQVVPQTMLIDRGGHVRGIFVGGGQRIIDSMNQNLDKVMSE